MARQARIVARPAAAVRPLLGAAHRAYVTARGQDGGLILPATATVRVVVKIEDSAWRPPQFVAGAHSSYLTVDGNCAPSYVELRLAPLAAFSILATPMDRLRGQLVDLTDVLGRDGSRLGDDVRGASTWDERFARIDRFLLQRAAAGPGVAPEVARAWRRLVASGGRIAVRDLAVDVGWSHKHLITRFRQQVGLTPRRAARLVRFGGVLRRLDAGPRPEWAQLAAEVGYADQAHLSREFREFTGSTPSGYLSPG